MSSLRAIARVVVALGPVALAGGCNDILGITEAAVDPTLGRDAATGDSGAPAEANSCVAYCDAIAKSCSENNQEYIDVSTCNAMCAYFEPGIPGEQTNDSLACRIFYAKQAATTPAESCSRAGPLAPGKCVSDPCSSFCTLSFNLCGPLDLFPFKDEDECRVTCARWPYLTAADAGGEVVGDILFAAGDTLNCRLYHLESAYEVGNPAAAPTHCRHIGDPSSTCR